MHPVLLLLASINTGVHMKVSMGQSLLFFNEHLYALKEALWEFHIKKSAIYNAGGQQEWPNLTLGYTKLELMLSVS